MLLLVATSFASGPTLNVTYTVQFDLDEMGDRLCGMTKLCDCSSTYTGTGEQISKQGDRVTFKGTWERTANTCLDAFWIWTPPDGVAHHTLRTSGGKLTEWVVHGDASNHTKRASDIKASGQFWMDALDHPWPAESAVIRQSDGSKLAGSFDLTANHMLALTVGSAPAAAER